MIIDGKSIAEERLKRLKSQVGDLGKTPKLAVILAGSDQVSEIYVRRKKEAGEKIGIEVEVLRFGGGVKTFKVLKTLKKLNEDPGIAGVLVQLPLPAELDKEKILAAIAPEKDVDGLTKNSPFLPATVRAVLLCLEEASKLLKLPKSLRNRTIVVVGQGSLVGKPLADYWERSHCRVVRCDVKTKNLKEKTLQADVLVVATGVHGLIKANMVKPGAVVIDCGSPGPEVGPGVYEIAGAYTPVPGGVGPVTVVSLLENVVEAT
jgi:methylenetetrahydrofolate dehydrogenase (NADP+)/methenyltetrahydrofolate cyclohydrolase